MAEVSTDKGGHEKGKPKKLSTRVDFTPMVDLGFLLITFFMLATSMAKPQTMEISMPSKDKVDRDQQNEVKSSKAMTIVLGKEGKIYYYFGTIEKGVVPQVYVSNFDPEGIRKILLENNKDVNKRIDSLKAEKAKKKVTPEEYKAKVKEFKGDKNAKVILIKPTDGSKYDNLVGILDEMNICNIGRYAIVPLNDIDRQVITPSYPDAFTETPQTK